MTHRDLLGGPAPTLLPTDPAAAKFGEDTDLVVAVAAHPASSLGWAMLAELALDDGTPAGDVRATRTPEPDTTAVWTRSGGRDGGGAGPVPWEHEPNRGFLRALWALSVAAGRIGEADEAERCAQFLRDSTEAGYAALAGSGDPGLE